MLDAAKEVFSNRLVTFKTPWRKSRGAKGRGQGMGIWGRQIHFQTLPARMQES
jgi:hypothetical protein